MAANNVNRNSHASCPPALLYLGWKSSPCLVKQISCSHEGSRKIIDAQIGLSAEEIRGAAPQYTESRTMSVQKIPLCLTLACWEGERVGYNQRVK